MDSIMRRTIRAAVCGAVWVAGLSCVLGLGVAARGADETPANTPAAVVTHDADWWYGRYQKLGHTDPKWDALVREGIDRWDAAYDKSTGRENKEDLARSVHALEKAYAAGCRCPIALFIDARNIMQTSADGTIVFERFRECMRRTENRPELTFVRIYCANVMGRRYMNGREYKDAIRYIEIALSLQSPDVEEQIVKEARANLAEAKEKLAAQEKHRARLVGLALPENATKDQARVYVRQILYAIIEKNGGGTEAERALLEKAGAANLDAILEIWGTTGPESDMTDWCVKATVGRLARAEDRPLLLKWLPFHIEIAEVMASKGWAQDMRPFLVERIAQRSTSLELPILRAAAQLRDPATYADLAWHFENNQNGANIYGDIRGLPGIDLKDAVLRIWARSKSWKGWEANRRYTIAAAAMEYGSTEALQFAVEQLATAPPTHWVQETLHTSIYDRTGQRGSDDEIRAWFEANKDKLVFDEKSRTFRPAN